MNVTLTSFAMGVAFAFSVLYLLLAVWGKKENEKMNMLFAIHSLLMCIALGIWELVGRSPL